MILGTWLLVERDDKIKVVERHEKYFRCTNVYFIFSIERRFKAT